MNALRTKRLPGPLVPLFGLLGLGCMSQSPPTPREGEPTGLRARPHQSASTVQVTVHVDAAAAPGGDGTTWETAFNAVTPAVAAACASSGERTVLVAAGDYPEKNIAVSCAVHIRGVSAVVAYGEDGFPAGVNAGVARLVPAPLEREETRLTPPGHSETIFRVTHSGVTLESLSLDGGNDPGRNYRLGSGIELGGGTGDVGQLDPRCSATAGIEGITIRDVAVTGAGIGIFASYASLRLSDSYLTGNGIGAAIDAGPDAEAYIVGNTFTANGFYGLGNYGRAAFDEMACAYDVEHPTATKLESHIIGNKISHHSFVGMRLTTRLYWGGASAVPEPDVMVTMETEVRDNLFEANSYYGATVDFISFFSIATRASYEGVFSSNTFVNNGRAPLHAGFTNTGWTVDYYDRYGWDPLFAYWAEDYVRDSSAELTVSPPVQVDWDNPVEGCLDWDYWNYDFENDPWPPTSRDCGAGTHIELGNTLTVNGEARVGRHITPLSQ